MPDGSQAMGTLLEVPVLIAGGGSVGLSMAAELAHRGVECLVVEELTEVNPHPRANAVASRTMEYYRRWGIADTLVESGIPPENPADYYWLSSLHGREIHRLSLPSHRALEELRRQTPFSPGERLHWSPYIKCNVGQDVVDQTLRDHLASQPGVDLRLGWRFEGFTDHGDHVTAEIRDLASPDREPQTVRAQYLVGCDGGRSEVRSQLGIRYEGAGSIAQFVSIYFRSPDLMAAHQFGPANIYFPLHRDHAGYLINWDRGESWTYHLELRVDEAWDDVDPVARITALVGQPITIDVVSVQPWTAHALTAASYRKGRVFLAGDAAHLFTPTGGFGMNTGVSDAIDLAWKLEAVLSGWGGEALLDSYETERRPIGVRNTQLARELYDRLASVMVHGDELDDEDPAADALRAELKTDLVEQESLIASFGVLLGYRYEGSPICVDDGTPPPDDHPQQYVPTSRPGHRAPHVWLSDDEALVDRLGVGFTLVATDSRAAVEPLVQAARRVGMPLDVVVSEHPDTSLVYERRLTLVRPDLMVAWRGDELPEDCAGLIDQVRGAQPATA